MRPFLSLLVLGVLAAGCGDTLAPPANLQGSWAADSRVPGASLVLNLTQPDGAITGSGTYTIEAGPSGTLQVSGAYTRPHVSLVLQYDYGLTRRYEGTVFDAHHMVGAISDSTGFTFALNFTHQ